jgi:hypothetical protein
MLEARMSEDKRAQDAVENVEKPAKEGRYPKAGPHAKPELTDNEKTPGTGALPNSTDTEADAGSE